MEHRGHPTQTLDNIEAALRQFIEGNCDAFIQNDSLASLLVAEIIEFFVGRGDDDWNLPRVVGADLG